MSATAAFAAPLVLAAAVTLVVAGVFHVRQPSALAGSVSVSVPIARMWGVVESAIGFALIGTLLAAPASERLVHLAGAAVFSAYSIWLAVRARSHDPYCACTGIATPIGWATISRSSGYALGLGLATVVGIPDIAASSTWLVVGVAGAAIGVLFWYLPEATAQTPASWPAGSGLVA